MLRDRMLPPAQEDTLTRLREARRAFLRGADPGGIVRPEILRSWYRSSLAGVSPTAQLQLHQGPTFEVDGLLFRAARPVIRTLLDDFTDAQVWIQLLNKSGQIIGRWVTSDFYEEMLQGICEIGSIVEEDVVGTTVLSTVLEEGRPMKVWGPEHYNDSLGLLSGAGAPIVHPGTGVVQGAISVGCDLTVPLGLVSSLVNQAARDIGSALMMGRSRADRELLDAYLRVERRGPRRPVIAINSRMRLSNMEALDRDIYPSQADLWEMVQAAASENASTGTAIREVQTPRGQRLAVRPVFSGRELVGGLIQLSGKPSVREQVQAPQSSIRHSTAKGHSSAAPGWLSGLRSEVERILKTAPSCLVYGAQHVGKYTLSRRVLEALGFAVLTCEAAELVNGVLAMSDEAGPTTPVCLIVRHLEAVPEDQLPTLERSLNRAARRFTLLVGTYRVAPVEGELPSWLEANFDAYLRVPSVSEMPQDVPALVADILEVHVADLDTVIDGDALRMLQERSLPGNVEQLERVLFRARALSGDRPITSADLPPKPRTQSRARRLTPLERVERDAIAAVLLTHGGNKVAAAQELELSRSTFYRRLSQLGLA
ncbi:helix-turn-helix domain-containing protein [Prescottella agglutinans]|nr:helix-turn-helix domain-containing protein [Prescottella agglutinans]